MKKWKLGLKSLKFCVKEHTKKFAPTCMNQWVRERKTRNGFMETTQSKCWAKIIFFSLCCCCCKAIEYISLSNWQFFCNEFSFWQLNAFYLKCCQILHWPISQLSMYTCNSAIFFLFLAPEHFMTQTDNNFWYWGVKHALKLKMKIEKKQ